MMHPQFNIQQLYVLPTLYLCVLYLKSHTKTLKFTPTCFGLIWNHPQGVHGCTSLGYWIVMLIYICYKECLYVAGCMSIHSVI